MTDDQTTSAPESDAAKATSSRTHPSGPLDGTQATIAHGSAASNIAHKALPPKVIAHYELVEKLGEGGMGAVYKGWHPKLQRFGAVKLLPPDVMQNPALVKRFEHEIALIAQLIIRMWC